MLVGSLACLKQPRGYGTRRMLLDRKKRASINREKQPERNNNKSRRILNCASISKTKAACESEKQQKKTQHIGQMNYSFFMWVFMWDKNKNGPKRPVFA